MHEHVVAAQEVRERDARVRVRVEMIAREVRVRAMDGFSPRLAEVAAKNNLAVRLTELDEEHSAKLGRRHGECHRKIGRLLEELQDE